MGMSYKEQNRLDKRQREWQTQENEKAFERNKDLAYLENTFNKEQWNRENEYNSPAAQMKRYTDAGLNPNLIYGQSNTSNQLSGSLSAGTPYEPVQGQFNFTPKNLEPYFKSLSDALMNMPLYREEVREKRISNDIKQTELDFENFKKQSSDPFGIERKLASDIPHNQRKYLQELNRSLLDAQSVTEDVRKKRIENLLQDEVFDDLVSKIQSESKVSKENANYLAKTAIYRIDEAKFSSELAELNKDYQKYRNEWQEFDAWFDKGMRAADTLGQFLSIKSIINMIGSRSDSQKFKKIVSDGDGKYHWE